MISQKNESRMVLPDYITRAGTVVYNTIFYYHIFGCCTCTGTSIVGRVVRTVCITINVLKLD